jgi:hypothetical protein
MSVSWLTITGGSRVGALATQRVGHNIHRRSTEKAAACAVTDRNLLFSLIAAEVGVVGGGVKTGRIDRVI